MTRAIVEFGCRTQDCGKIIEEVIEISDPDFSAERMSDGDVFEEHHITCSRCHADYEVETVNGFGDLTASLQPSGDKIEAHIYFSAEDFDFDDFEPAKNPLPEYHESVKSLQVLLNASGQDSTSILNRMIFSQYIATMEAYITDKLLQLCSENSEIEQRVVEKAGIFKEAKIPLAEALRDPSAAGRFFQARLKSVLYHDLDKVNGIYKIALRGPMFPVNSAGKVEQTLLRAISLRHDCVHRNGMTKDGQLNRFEAAYISEVALAIDELIQQVEKSSAKAIKDIRDGETV